MKKIKLFLIPTITTLVVPICSCSTNGQFNQIIANEIGNDLTFNNEYVEQFLANPIDDNVQAEGLEEKSKPIPVHLSWTANSPSNTKFTIQISEKEDMSDPYVIETYAKYLDLYNCKINTQYYWTVQSGSIISNVSRFKSKQTNVRTINIDGVTNCRDLGGYSTSDGKHIKQGLMYRTAKYNESYRNNLNVEITKEGVYTFTKQLNIKTEIDLRENEYEAGGLNGKSCIPGVDYHAYWMDGHNPNMLAHNAASIKGLFDNILSNPDSYPLSFHCSQGTDRSGCIAYTILAACGVDKKDLIADYLLSNYSLIGSARKFADIENNYPKIIDKSEGDTLKDKAANALLVNCGVSLETINKVRDILIE